MTSCADLDPFFDGELSEEAAADFREHLAGCGRCQAVLRGRMQEEAVVWDGQDRVAQHRVASIRPAPSARRRVLVYVAPVLAVAAAVAIWLIGTRGDGQVTSSARPGLDGLRSSPIEVALAIEHRGAATRSGAGGAREGEASVARVGDIVRTEVRGERHRAIWVYLEGRELVMACPGGAGCSSIAGSLALEFRVPAPGQYSIIAIGSAQPIITPHGLLDLMLSRVAAAGAHFQIRRVDVN